MWEIYSLGICRLDYKTSSHTVQLIFDSPNEVWLVQPVEKDQILVEISIYWDSALLCHEAFEFSI